MHRTQIYFDEDLFSDIKQAARRTNQSMSGYIREVLKQELDAKNRETQKTDFSDFSGIWRDYDITQDELRSKAWK